MKPPKSIEEVALLVTAVLDSLEIPHVAEDTVLAKLEWFRMGGEVSERQWRDVLGVLKTQGERLDVDYLRKWATELHVLDLLEQALVEANREE